MATLVLAAAGSALGGAMGAAGVAIGGALGAMVGRSVDALVFRPSARTGPRLSDLQVQTSRYGAPIPRLHGTLRVAGTVVWATDLQESKMTGGGGKGQPSVTSYTYSASLAVALSSRSIVRVGRIWADGYLLRGAGGDFKSPVGAMRVHLGGPDQPVDPLIASAVGSAQAPAYRGCAYVVFEALQLSDFGNRIPSLTFEVIADSGSVSVHSIASDLAGRTVWGEGGEAGVDGFAAEGSLQEAMGDLAGLHDLQWQEAEAEVRLTRGFPSDHALDLADAVREIDGRRQAETRHLRTPIESVPARLAIRYHDPARDYQLGVQAADRPGPGGVRDEIDLPAAVSAIDAGRLANRKLRALLRRRRSVEMVASWSAVTLRRGDIVSLGGEAGQWLVETCEWEDMAVRLRLRPYASNGTQSASPGEPGDPVRQPDLVQGPTSLAIVELPGDGTFAATSPIIMVAATGSSAGWRRAALFRYNADLEAAEPIGNTAPRAIIGTTAGALNSSEPWRLDLRNAVEVVLDDESEVLTSVGDDLLIGGANLCQIGEELLQFGQAEWVSPGRYRLSRFVRGRYGTEWACFGHEAAERFVLLEEDRLQPLVVPPGDVGALLTVRAVGSGDALPASAQRLVDGRAMLPPAPTHGSAVHGTSGDLELSWIRRSRLGWAWVEGTDAPLGEEQEAYVVSAMLEGIELRRWEVAVPAATYPQPLLAADLALASSAQIHVEVRQRGSWGLSRPLTITIS